MEASEPEPARTATGVLVPHYGKRDLRVEFPDGNTGSIRFNAMGVHKTVLSVSELNLAGHSVCFLPDRAFISKGTRELPLVRENGVFYLEASLLGQPARDIFTNETALGSSAAASSSTREKVAAVADIKAKAPPLPLIPTQEEK